MADHELRLVSKIIRSGEIAPVLERGVTTEWFVNTEAKEMFAFSLRHFENYQKTPEPATVRNALPGVSLLHVNEDLKYLIDAFVEWRRRGLIHQLLQDAIDQMEDNNHEAALDLVASEAFRIADVGLENRDIDLRLTTEERIEEYKRLQGLPNGMRGIPTGFPTIDQATLGLQPGQLVTIVATPKAGKSTLLLRIARHVWKQNEPVVYVSFEMPNEETYGRHDSMAARIAHKDLLSGRFGDGELDSLQRALNRMKDKPNAFILVNDPTGNSTVTALAAKIAKYRPKALFVDGVYLMYDPDSKEHGSREALTNITRSMKRLAMREGIPIITSTQVGTWKIPKGANGRITGDSILYTSSFHQDSDVILGLEYPDGDETIQDERVLRIVSSRACPPTEVGIVWDWDTGTFEEPTL